MEDRIGRTVGLTAERWEHIVSGHPELAAHEDAVMSAVRRPDRCVAGRQDKEEWLYLRTTAPSAWLKVVVAYAGSRGYVVTAYARRSMP